MLLLLGEPAKSKTSYLPQITGRRGKHEENTGTKSLQFLRCDEGDKYQSWLKSSEKIESLGLMALDFLFSSRLRTICMV